MSIRPTKKQKELLDFIGNFVSGHGYGPSYREIMRGIGYKSVSTVATHIDNLIARGHLRKRTHSARSLEVVQDHEKPFEPGLEITPEQEKWLVTIIKKKFDDLEAQVQPDKKQIDELYVLVGALKILGMDQAVQSFKDRLNKLQRQ
jgi:repressor LexA